MPISKHFLKSFEQFITSYRLSGATSSYISWGKEQNHSAICDYFSELLNLIKSNQEVIHDASVIEYLTVPINLSTNTNRYLYECWNKFLIEYNSVAKMYNPINTIDSSTPMHLQIAVEGNSSERMMRDLKSALDSTQKAQEFSRKAYLSEVELLKKQIEELARENNQLSTENRTLKEQVHNDQTFRALQPQIETARHQLTSFTELLNTLYEITGSNTTIVAPVSTTALPSLSKEGSLYKVTTPVISDTTKKQLKTTTTVSSPKITPLIPEKDTPSKRAVLSEPENTVIIKSKIPSKAPLQTPPEMPPPQKTGPLFSGDGFFNELSQELAKRKANKAAFSSTAAVEKIEPIQKKNM